MRLLIYTYYCLNFTQHVFIILFKSYLLTPQIPLIYDLIFTHKTPCPLIPPIQPILWDHIVLFMWSSTEMWPTYLGLYSSREWIFFFFCSYKWPIAPRLGLGHYAQCPCSCKVVIYIEFAHMYSMKMELRSKQG